VAGGGFLSAVIALHWIASSHGTCMIGRMRGRRALLSRVAIVFMIGSTMLLLDQFMCVFLTQIGGGAFVWVCRWSGEGTCICMPSFYNCFIHSHTLFFFFFFFCWVDLFVSSFSSLLVPVMDFISTLSWDWVLFLRHG